METTAETSTTHIKLRNKKERNGSYLITMQARLQLTILYMFGYLNDFLRKIRIEKSPTAIEKKRDGYVPLYKSFESFFTRNFYRRTADCFNQAITATPGPEIILLERVSDDGNNTFRLTGKSKKVINTASYNYLGFAENTKERIEFVEEATRQLGVGVCSARNEFGTFENHRELEKTMATFFNVEDSIVCGMGFAINSNCISALMGEKCLILSDELNHASLILGCRLSGAVIEVFKHNDMNDLEQKLRKNIAQGVPRTHIPWRKILIIVEGIYSMEGTIVNLPEIIRLKKKYKAYLYLDEAHSIGGLGQKGRGVTEHFGCDPKDVDILMGTFSKSFAASGGYIAGSKQLIDYLRTRFIDFTYGNSIATPIVRQIIYGLEILMDPNNAEGRERVQRLAENTAYLRAKLKQMGFIVIGDDDSPVVPVKIGLGSKMSALARFARDRGLAAAVVGFPATYLSECRLRLCVSASLTRETLDKITDILSRIGDEIGIKYAL